MNYSAAATITGTAREVDGMVIQINSASDHASSHDRDYLCTVKYFRSTGIYSVPSLYCNITVNYQDVSTPLKYQHTMLEARAYVAPGLPVGPIVPVRVLP